MSKKSLLIICFFLFCVLFQGWGKAYPKGWQEKGIASWYGGKFQGRLTANGEYFDTYQLTAAHKELPFGSIVRIENLDSGLSVEVRINDRGPFVKNRIIDLSFEAAKKIGMTGKGTANVLLTVLKEGKGETFHHLRKADHSKKNLKRIDFFSVDWIQLGAFSSQANAIRRKKELADKGFSSEILFEKGLYKVGIPTDNGESAKKLIEKLDRLGYQSLVTKRKKEDKNEK